MELLYFSLTIFPLYVLYTVFGMTLLPETYNILLFVLPPGAFITLGFLIAIVNKIRN